MLQFLHVRNSLKSVVDINILSFQEMKDKLQNKVMSGVSLERYVAMALSVARGHSSFAEDLK